MEAVTAGGGSADSFDQWLEKWITQHVLRDVFKTMLKTEQDPPASGQVVSMVANNMARLVAFGP